MYSSTSSIGTSSVLRHFLSTTDTFCPPLIQIRTSKSSIVGSGSFLQNHGRFGRSVQHVPSSQSCHPRVGHQNREFHLRSQNSHPTRANDLYQTSTKKYQSPQNQEEHYHHCMGKCFRRPQRHICPYVLP